MANNLPNCVQCDRPRTGKPADPNWPDHCGRCAAAKGPAAEEIAGVAVDLQQAVFHFAGSI